MCTWPLISQELWPLHKWNSMPPSSIKVYALILQKLLEQKMPCSAPSVRKAHLGQWLLPHS